MTYEFELTDEYWCNGHGEEGGTLIIEIKPTVDIEIEGGQSKFRLDDINVVEARFYATGNNGVELWEETLTESDVFEKLKLKDFLFEQTFERIALGGD